MPLLERGRPATYCIPFSHAAWWIASEAGTRTIVLDDPATWQSAFSKLLKPIVAAVVRVYRTDPLPVDLIEARQFDGVEVDYPCKARHGFGGPPFTPGRDTFLACAFERPGDRYFTAEKGREPKWQGLMVSSEDLLSIWSPPRWGSKEITPQHIEDYQNYAQARRIEEGDWPTREEDTVWGQRRGLSRELTRQLRRIYRSGPEFETSRKGGAPKNVGEKNRSA